MKEIIYIKHPLSREDKAELVGKYRIFDLKYAPADYKDPQEKPKRARKKAKKEA